MKPVVERVAAVAIWAASLAPLWAWWGRRLGEPIDIDVVAWAALVVLVVRGWWLSFGLKDLGPGRGSQVVKDLGPGRGPQVAKDLGPGRRLQVAKNLGPGCAPPTWRLLLAAAGLAAFHLLRGVVPPTVSGVFAVLGGVPLLLPAGERVCPCLGLAFMGLPTMMILDLFLGLPLRAVATASAVALLESAGLPVVQTGLEIAVGGTSVWVDVPCAGVHMLGTGALAAFVLAALFRLDWWRTALLAVAAVFTVVVANVARIVVLAVFALRGVELSPSAHSAVGCALLVPSILAIALLAHLMTRRRK